MSVPPSALHGLQIHALAGYLRRLLVFLVDFEEPCGLDGHFRNGLLLVGPVVDVHVSV